MKVFVTRGTGAVGCNLANHHLSRGQGSDLGKLSRIGTDSNLVWSKENHSERVRRWLDANLELFGK